MPDRQQLYQWRKKPPTDPPVKQQGTPQTNPNYKLGFFQSLPPLKTVEQKPRSIIPQQSTTKLPIKINYGQSEILNDEKLGLSPAYLRGLFKSDQDSPVKDWTDEEKQTLRRTFDSIVKRNTTTYEYDKIPWDANSLIRKSEIATDVTEFIKKRNLIKGWAVSGYPKVKWVNKKELVDGSREFYTPDDNEMTIDSSNARTIDYGFFSELPHAWQWKHGDTIGNSSDSRLQRNQYDKTYDIPGTIEYNAHKVIQQPLKYDIIIGKFYNPKLPDSLAYGSSLEEIPDVTPWIDIIKNRNYWKNKLNPSK